ncbi:MAG: hypothetical protein KatS3mg076_0923 [Candidatus Binatia bacterium]|nr:MAG: hypothetical protein KatS3mg076_0923 [Candidatus Binatia bacterium]
MAATRLTVNVDGAMEKATGVRVEACSAFYDPEDNEVRVFAELAAEGQTPVDQFRGFHAALYDEEGTLLGTDADSWVEFGLRRTVQLNFYDVCGRPARVKVFPTASP